MRIFMEWLSARRRAIFYISLVGVAALTFYWYRLGIFTDEAKLRGMLDSAGLAAPLLFTIVQAVQVVIPILPGAVGCVYGVAFFGAVWGFVYNYLGICAGSVLAFLISRACGKDLAAKITSEKFYSKYSKYLLDQKFFDKFFALMIFLPLAPDDFLCYLVGVSKMSLKKFTLIILLGKPAAILLYSMGLYKAISLLKIF